MERKTVKATAKVKFRLELAKKIIGVKSESDAISYLLELYRILDEGGKISTRMHNDILKTVKHLNEQEEMMYENKT